MLRFSGYTTTEQLHESDHSLIFRGWREADQRPVVLKLLRREYPSQEDIAGFRREYEFTRQLEHVEGIIRAYDLHRHQNTYVMILEDFGGESLTKLIAAQPLAWPELLHLAIQITEILGALHQQRVIHKDINPSNIIWRPLPDAVDNSRTGPVKLIDFGIAEIATRQSMRKNPLDRLEGTLAYISPEQTGRINRPVDYRTDLYSLGATLYHLFTGQLPFQADDMIELVHSHIAKMPISPSAFFPHPAPLPEGEGVFLPSPSGSEVPQILSAIIMKLMAKAPEERYQSAYGLKVDLQRCVELLHATGPVEVFTLGQQDMPARLQLSHMLYGRDRELAALESLFEQVRTTGRPAHLIVTGETGIGKTALVQAWQSQLTDRQAYFISGKFDQLARNVPYSAIIQAGRAMLRHILAEPEEQIMAWKHRLQEAVGPNGRVVSEIIPEVDIMLGPQPELPELPPEKTQNRFHLVFRNVLQTLATQEHPLVVFLDGIQWADAPSLKLIEFLMASTSIPYLLLICACRAHEIHGTHLLRPMFEAFQDHEITTTIALSPLTHEHICHFMLDTLRCDAQQAESLAEVLLRKTHGNPFFLRQFVQALNEDGVLTFASDAGRWEWDLPVIHRRSITDNVVEVMAGKIQQLPDAARQALTTAACVGSQFDLETLAAISHHTSSELADHLSEAVQEGLIVLVEDVADERGERPASDFRFLHTRIQQAAYSLVGDQQKHATHVAIGRHLLTRIPEDRQGERIFEILQHFNIGQSLLTDPDERLRVARLNLVAGQKARSSAAYQSAYDYLMHGIALLHDTGWRQHYDLMLALYTEAAEAAYLSGHHVEMESLTNRVLEQATNLADKAKIYENRILALISQKRLVEAVRLALRVLRLFGIRFKQKPGKLTFLLYFLHIKALLIGKRIENSTDLPEVTDPHNMAAMRIMTIIGAALYFTDPKLTSLAILAGVKLSLKYGNSPASAVAYSAYGLFLCGVTGNIERGYHFGQLALQVLEHFHSQEFKPRVLHVVNTCIRHWKEHYQDVLPAVLEGYHCGLDTGDIEFASYATGTYSYLAFFLGENLKKLDQDYGEFIRAETHYANRCLRIYQRLVGYLVGDREPLDKEIQAPPAAEAELLERFGDDRHAVFQWYFTHLLLCYLFRAYPQAAAYADLAEQYLDGAVGVLCVPLYYFYDALTRLALYPEASAREQQHILRRVIRTQNKIDTWSRYAPMNHRHRWYLIAAERARVLGQDVEAAQYYDRAIELARQHAYPHDVTLAHELAAEFYAAQGRQKLAQVYIRDARYGYLTRQVMAKVNAIDQRYPDIAAMNRRQSQNLFLKTDTTLTATSVTATHAQFWDLASALKASQAISGEIVLENLLQRLLTILLENAGSQRAVLLLKRDDRLLIEAEGHVTAQQDQQTIELGVRQAIPLDTYQQIAGSVVLYVAHAQQPVVLHNASREGDFTTDPYILAQQSRSVLCAPIMHGGQLSGVVYLENSLATGVFSSERLELIQLLSTQAAISLENARLYEELQRYNETLEAMVTERTIELQEKNVQLQELNASKDKFFSIISHDLRTPFTTLLGYTDLMITAFDTYTPELLKDHLERIHTSAERLYVLLENLLTWSRIQRGVMKYRPEKIPLSVLVNKVVELFLSKAEQKQISLTTTIPAGLLVSGDANMVNTVIRNLVSNALKFTSQGGTVTITAHKQIAVPQQDTQYIEVAVSDTGKGIDEDALAKLFRPDAHYTTLGTAGETGTGLGLLLCKELVEKNGGQIWVESKVGKGTKFSFTLIWKADTPSQENVRA